MSQPLSPCPNYIGGEWPQPKIAGTPVCNPSTGDVMNRAASKANSYQFYVNRNQP